MRGLAALLVLLLGAPTAVADAQALRVGVPAVPAALEPGAALEGVEALIARQVFDTLLRYADGSSELEPGLAVSWRSSRDGLTWSFRLREGITFSDGTPLSAFHVVQSLERLILPAHAQAPAPNPAARLVRGTPGVVRELRAVDAGTVQIQLLLPYAPLLAVLAHPAFAVAHRGPGGWLGTGPFAVGELAPGRIVLDARPGHWAGGPRVPRIVFAAVDEAQALAALDANGLDVWLPRGRPPRAAGAVSMPSWRIGYLALQTEKEPFRRVKARRAVAAALDPAGVAAALGDLARPLATFLPPGVWGRRDGPAAPVGMDHARALLAEAGVPAGQPVVLLVPQPEGADAPLAQVVGDALTGARLGVTINRVEPGRALALAQAGEHQLTLWEALAEAGDPHFLLYPLSATEGAVKGPSATNLSFYRNAKLDDPLIRASQLAFRPERQRLYQRAQALLAEEMPWVPLYVRLHWAVVRPEVKGLRLHPSGVHRLERVSVDPAAPPAR
jgi:peptide/nickel transport system substrate-binding protein